MTKQSKNKQQKDPKKSQGSSPRPERSNSMPRYKSPPPPPTKKK